MGVRALTSEIASSSSVCCGSKANLRELPQALKQGGCWLMLVNVNIGFKLLLLVCICLHDLMTANIPAKTGQWPR